MGFLEAVSDGIQDNKTAVVVGGVGAVAAIAYYATRGSRYQKKPSSLQLTGGAVAADQVKGQVGGQPMAAAGYEAAAGVGLQPGPCWSPS